MSPPPHREKDAKVEAGPPQVKATEERPNDLFRALAQKLVRVPVSEVREAERLYQADKAERSKDA